MDKKTLIPVGRQLSVTEAASVPALIESAGRQAKRRFVEFFTANIKTTTRERRTCAASVRGPKLVIVKGKTPVLSADDTRTLLDSIDVTKIAGLRDRALIGVMVYGFARIGAALFWH
jgi:site-specific recombinase XerD